MDNELARENEEGCESRAASPSRELRCRVLGLAWLLLGGVKMIGESPSSFAVPGAAVATVAVSEAALGVWLLTSPSPRVAGASLCFSLSLVAAAILFELPSCGCFGSMLTSTRTGRLAVSASLAIMSGWALGHRPARAPDSA